MKKTHKLTIQDVESIPKRLETKVISEVANDLHITKSSLNRWIAKFRKNGVEIKVISHRGIMEKIKNEHTS